MRDLLSVPAMRPPGSPRTGVPGRLHREAAGERPPRARPQRRGSPGPIPNPAVKPAFAESTAARGCGRAGRRARGGRFSIGAEKARRGGSPCGPLCVSGSIAGGSPRSTLRAADLAGVRCVRGVRAERMDGFLCLCRWCCNSPGLAGAILAFGIIWHLVRVDFQGILVFEFGAVVGYR